MTLLPVTVDRSLECWTAAAAVAAVVVRSAAAASIVVLGDSFGADTGAFAVALRTLPGDCVGKGMDYQDA